MQKSGMRKAVVRITTAFNNCGVCFHVTMSQFFVGWVSDSVTQHFRDDCWVTLMLIRSRTAQNY
jgi:hypothetical protein